MLCVNGKLVTKRPTPKFGKSVKKITEQNMAKCAVNDAENGTEKTCGENLNETGKRTPNSTPKIVRSF